MIPWNLQIDDGTRAALTELVEKKLLLEAIRDEKESRAHARHIQGHAAIEGIGGQTMSIPANEYYKAIAHYGHGCWEDKSFCDYYLRKTPEARVKSKGTKFQVGWMCDAPGVEPVWAGSVREVKKYPESNASD